MKIVFILLLALCLNIYGADKQTAFCKTLNQLYCLVEQYRHITYLNGDMHRCYILTDLMYDLLNTEILYCCTKPDTIKLKEITKSAIIKSKRQCKKD